MLNGYRRISTLHREGSRFKPDSDRRNNDDYREHGRGNGRGAKRITVGTASNTQTQQDIFRLETLICTPKRESKDESKYVRQFSLSLNRLCHLMSTKEGLHKTLLCCKLLTLAFMRLTTFKAHSRTRTSAVRDASVAWCAEGQLTMSKSRR